MTHAGRPLTAEEAARFKVPYHIEEPALEYTPVYKEIQPGETYAQAALRLTHWALCWATSQSALVAVGAAQVYATLATAEAVEDSADG